MPPLPGLETFEELLPAHGLQGVKNSRSPDIAAVPLDVRKACGFPATSTA